ncbi:PGPGW domain-containing protein [Thalassiella azotivora]
MSDRAPSPPLRDTREDANWVVDADEDRWEWRRRIRSDPRKHRVYRVCVGVLGAVLILLGAATGWLPGPGGIPLVLAGLAVLASEFEWAQRILERARRALHRGGLWLRRQPRWVSWLGGAGTAAGVAVGVWVALAVFGYPAFTPEAVAGYLGGLPGVDAAD